MLDNPTPKLPEESPVRVKPCRHGTFMYNVHDTVIGRSLDAYGEYLELAFGLFHQLIRPGMVAFDVGAHIGAHAVGLSKAVGTTGQVVAFEPQRVIYQMLCGNLALNALTNVMALMAALGSKVGSIAVPAVDYSIAGNFGIVELTPEIPANPKSEVVPLLTIDSFNFRRCDFMKIAVEEMELAVLEGAVQTINRCKPILYVANKCEGKSQAIIDFLFKQDYRLYWHTPPLFNPSNYANRAENIFPEEASIHMLCIPKDMPVQMSSFTEITSENASDYIRSIK